MTGSSCSGPAGTFNYGFAEIEGYEDSCDIVRFEGGSICDGDSGGAIVNAEGTRLFGVHSMSTPFSDKGVTTGGHFDWIKSHVCLSSRRNQ